MDAASRPRVDLRLILLLGIALLLVALELIGAFPKATTPLERVEWIARDSLMRLRGVQQPGGQIVIVAIDDFSLNWVGKQWPWPRAYLAEIIQRLNEAGAHLIGMDIMLFEEGYDAGGDEALAAALSRTPLSVSVMQIFPETIQGFTTTTLKLPIDIYADTFTAVGLTGIFLDEDAIERRLQVYDRFGDQLYFNWSFAVASLALGVEPPRLTPEGVIFNGRQVPLSQGYLLVNYAGPAGTYPTYRAADVHDGLIEPDAFRDKIVLLGASSYTLKDVFPTPFSPSTPTPGVEIVANAVDMLMSGRYLHVTPPWANLLIILLTTLLTAWIGRIPRPGWMLATMLGVMLIYWGICFFVFARFLCYLPVAAPEAMLFFGVVLPTIEQAVSQEMEKRRVRALFIRFISPEMVDQLLETRDINALNKRAELTVMFSDIRGFTTLSERLVPEEVVHLLNPYLEMMTSVIHEYGGTVDKYEGDAIVAFFGEPVPYADHALRAARAALAMRAALVQLKERWRQEGRLPAHFEIGIGLNTGEVFVGLLGSAQRLNYTVIGDNVNLAARLQDLTKSYGWPILISESTALAIQEEFDVEFIEAAQVRGKNEPVRIYKILGRKGAPESERVKALEF